MCSLCPTQRSSAEFLVSGDKKTPRARRSIRQCGNTAFLGRHPRAARVSGARLPCPGEQPPRAGPAVPTVTHGGSDDSAWGFQAGQDGCVPRPVPVWPQGSGRPHLAGAAGTPELQGLLGWSLSKSHLPGWAGLFPAWMEPGEAERLGEGGTQTGEATTSSSFGHEERWLKYQHFPLQIPKHLVRPSPAPPQQQHIHSSHRDTKSGLFLPNF